MFSVAVLTAGLRAIKEASFADQIVEDLDFVDGVGLVGILKKMLIFQLEYPVFVVVASEQVLDVWCVDDGSQVFENSFFYFPFCLLKADRQQSRLCQLAFALENVIARVLLFYLKFNYLLLV